MFFDDNEVFEEPKERQLPEAGEYVCEIVRAEEKEIPWAKPNKGLFIFLKNPAGVEFEDITHLEEQNGKRRAAVLCNCVGIDPIGTVEANDLVGRRVGAEVRIQTAKSGTVYAKVSRFFTPPVDPNAKNDVPW